MNLFRLTGDLLHLASFFILLLKIYTTRSVKGVSLKTQVRLGQGPFYFFFDNFRFVFLPHFPLTLCNFHPTFPHSFLSIQALYVLIFITRYLDLFWNFRSLYNSIMKVVFIALSVAIVYVMKYEKPYNKTYDAAQDFFNPLFLIVPAFVLALLVNEEFTFFEVLWTFSIYLEAVAIIPQLIVIHKCAVETGGFVDTLNSHYVFALGGYRALYFMNWIYRLLVEDKYRNWIVWTAGLVQSAIYCDFFWHYLKARMEGTKMTLPI